MTEIMESDITYSCCLPRLPPEIPKMPVRDRTGTWKLLDASCGRCRNITSLFELRVLREHFLAFRTATAMPTRRPKERPRTLTQRVIAEGRASSHELLPEDHPAPLIFPIFPPPTGFASAPENRIRAIAVECRSGKGRVEALAAQTGADQWTFPFAEAETFARFIGKVGYCFAVGCFGMDIVNDACVRPFIREGGGGIAAWVGCRIAPVEGGPPMVGKHEFRAVIGRDELYVDVCLFELPSSPIYTVIVGRP
jgi:hypothetical protein